MKTDDEDVARIRKIQVEQRVHFRLGTLSQPVDPDEKQAEVYIEIHKKSDPYGCPARHWSSEHLIGRDPAKSVEENLKKFKEVWPGIIKVAEENNVKIGIENCPMLFTRDGGLAVKPGNHTGNLRKCLKLFQVLLSVSIMTPRTWFGCRWTR